MNFLKYAFQSLIIIMVFLSIPSSVTADPSKEKSEIVKPASKSFEEVSLTQSEVQSRNSSVRVESKTRFGSGTYAIISKRRVVITAAHVVSDGTDIFIWGRDGERVRGSVIFIDHDNDFAIVSLVSKMKTRKPLGFHLAQKHSNRLNKLVGSNICYTGFPHGHDLLTIRGSISGVDRGFLMIQSYAWSGASGSGVFNDYGEFVGVLVAVDVGFADGHIHLVESMVLVVPISNIEMRLIKAVIEEKIPL